MINKIVIVGVVLLCFIACADQKLYFQNVPDVDLLDITGVFINDSDLNNDTGYFCEVFLLYSNSAILRSEVFKSGIERDLDDVISFFYGKKVGTTKPSYPSKINTGVFNISKDSIRLEYWESSYTGMAYKTLVKKGVIIDSTTFMIDQGYSNYTKEYFKLDTPIVYKLHYLKNKPESIIKHITEKED